MLKLGRGGLTKEGQPRTKLREETERLLETVLTAGGLPAPLRLAARTYLERMNDQIIGETLNEIERMVRVLRAAQAADTPFLQTVADNSDATGFNPS